MAEVSQQQVEAALKEVVDPYLDQDLVTAKSVKNIAVDGGKVTVDIVMGYPNKGSQDGQIATLKSKIESIDGVDAATINMANEIKSHAVQQGVKPIDGIKNIIAIASGKGGVGKSTTAVNLALALSAEGATVGMLDADIYGPSQPRMLGVSGQPESADGKTLEPDESITCRSMSIGYLIDARHAHDLAWPMVTQALEQFCATPTGRISTTWSSTLPPGTGDTQLTLAQKVPVRAR